MMLRPATLAPIRRILGVWLKKILLKSDERNLYRSVSGEEIKISNLVCLVRKTLQEKVERLLFRSKPTTLQIEMSPHL